MKVAKAGALVAPGAMIAMGSEDGKTKLLKGVRAYTGYDGFRKEWHLTNLGEGWLPYIGVTFAEKGIAFVNRLIRSL